MEVLLAHPVVTVEMAAALTGRYVQAANAALAALEEAGIVRSTGKWRRVFEAGQALALVETFERDLTRAKLGRQSERGASRRRGPGPER